MKRHLQTIKANLKTKTRAHLLLLVFVNITTMIVLSTLLMLAGLPDAWKGVCIGTLLGTTVAFAFIDTSAKTAEREKIESGEDFHASTAPLTRPSGLSERLETS